MWYTWLASASPRDETDLKVPGKKTEPGHQHGVFASPPKSYGVYRLKVIRMVVPSLKHRITA